MQNKEKALWSIKLFEELKANRQDLEKLWQEIAHLVRPQQSTQGQNSTSASSPKDIYDSTAILAADYLVSGLWSLISNNSLNWFALAPKDINSQNNNQMNEWLVKVNNIIKENLSDSEGGFYYKSYEFYADLVCFGTAIFYVAEDLENSKLIYQTNHLASTYLHQLYDEIDTVFKTLKLTARQAIDLFGKDNIHQNIKKNHKDNPEELFDFLHVTLPTKHFKSTNLHTIAINNMKYTSYYVDMQNQQVLQESGYYEFPYMIARWYTNTNQIYGQSPAMSVLADIKMINVMSKTILIAAQKQVDPPILAPNEASVQGIKAIPGSVIYGGIDPLSGNQLLKPLLMGGDINNAYALQEQRKTTIKDAFYVDLLLYNYANNATATEILAVNEQKLRVLGAKVARIQSEFLSPLLKRVFAIMQRLNLLPALPKSVNKQEIAIEVDFINSWNRQQKIQENMGLMRMEKLLQQINQFDDSIADSIDWQEVLKLVLDANGIPKNLIKTFN